MKLPKITTASKSARFSFTMPEDEADLVNEYATYYANVHKGDVSLGTLIRHIVKHYIETDKDFIKSKKSAKSRKINVVK